MPKVLSESEIKQYMEEGYFYPVEIMPIDDMGVLRRQLEVFESKQSHPIEGQQRTKAHLLFKWIDDLMRHPILVDAVEDLIGPDILCWNTAFWIKEAQTPTYVGWHQDLQYWGLDNDEMVSVWIALSPATAESGCMSVMPRSHKKLLAHKETYHEDNMLTRGQEIEINNATTVAMPLQPGQASFHNVKSAHGSGPNKSKDRRIGLSMHYMPTHTRQLFSKWDSAALVRGEDTHNHFVHTPIPVRDFDPEAVAFHQRASNTLREIVYKDAQQASKPTL